MTAAMVSVIMVALIMHAGAIGPPPALPHTFWGTVTIDGELAPNGTVVSVRVGDICVENTTITNGYYLLIVQENDANFGDLLYFYVDNIFIGEKPAFTSGGVTQLNLSVVQPSPTSINITPDTTTLNINEIQQFTATVLPDDADQTVTWIVVNETGSGIINETGYFTPLTAGTVNITAISVVDTNITRNANVTVTEPSVEPPVPESITITPDTTTLNVNDIQQFTTNVSPEGADQNVTWIVDNITGNGTINETGLFTALTAGIVNVTAISVVDANITRTTNVTVVEPPVEPPAPEVPGFGIIATILALLTIILALLATILALLKEVLLFKKNKK